MKLTILLCFSSLNLTLGSLDLWVDTGFAGKDFEDLDYRLGFLMDNYQIISLEKCMHEGPIAQERTEDVFHRLTTRMRELRPNSTAKIIYYWHVDIMYKCYHAIDYLVTKPDLWLYDDNGEPVRRGSHDYPYVPDYRNPAALDLWVSSAAKVVEQCEGKCQGVFADGFGHLSFKGHECGRTYGKVSACQISEQTENEWNEAKIRALGALRDRLHEIDASNLLLGNDVSNIYWDAKKEKDFDKNLDVVDGVVRDHFMTFSEVDCNAADQPFVRPERIEKFWNVREKILKKNKTLLIRGAPGPIGKSGSTTIIDGSNEYSIPSLPPNYWYSQPTTTPQVKQAYKDLLNYPLAVYLCGFADDNVYFSYSYYHSLKEYIPNILYMPPDLDQLLNNNPGAPLTEPIWTGRTCTRQFENFGVSVNIEDDRSVLWLPTALPSNSSTLPRFLSNITAP